MTGADLLGRAFGFLLEGLVDGFEDLDGFEVWVGSVDLGELEGVGVVVGSAEGLGGVDGGVEEAGAVPCSILIAGPRSTAGDVDS